MNILWEESQGRMKIHDTGMYSVIYRLHYL
jgi:hypothetical protein